MFLAYLIVQMTPTSLLDLQGFSLFIATFIA